MNDFDTVNMNKLQKAKYYLKEYGFAYTMDRGLKKLGFPISSDLEYTGWLKRRRKGLEKEMKGSERVRILTEEELAGKTTAPEVEEELVIFKGRDTVLDEAYLPELMKAASENKNALLFYTDSDLISKNRRFRPYFRPDWSPELLLTFPYVGEVFAVRKELLKKIEYGFPLTGNWWYELILRLSAVLKEEEVWHISFPLWSKKVEKGFQGFYRPSDPKLKRAIEEHIKRQGWKGEVCPVPGAEGFYYVKWAMEREPLVSVLIPNKDHIGELSTCIDSLLKVNTYSNIEILIVENNSEEKETFDYYESLKDERIRVVSYEGGFNYSAINNFAAKNAKGELLLLLNNDTEVLAPEALRTLAAAALRPGCGAAGAMLYYPDGTIQHGGVTIKIGGFAANSLWSLTDRDETYFPYSVTKREMTACTAACLMIRREAFEKAGGFHEELAVALNDVDLCLRIRKSGFKILFCPEARLTHFESKSRGMEDDPKKQERFQREIALFQEIWQETIDAGDPYYNVNQTLHYANYSIELAEDNRGRYKC